MTDNSIQTFERLESEVRSYCRAFPTVFTTAEGAELTDADGKKYIDFFGGAGALNYGHNHPALREALVDYIQSGGITHSLDMHSAAKRTFLERLEEVLLKPRDMTYKVMFPGPTGTNSVEMALKLARKVTGRHNVVSFTNGFHGMTLGALSVTGNAAKRAGAHLPLNNASQMPFDGYFSRCKASTPTLDYFEHALNDRSSGLDKPAAVILETVQAEGGVNVASVPWLERLGEICKQHEIMLIADDIQVGCGRTGPFFSFERAPAFSPDMICLSKSLSAYGTPLAVVLVRPELDRFNPGEHNGTFRGHNLAFVTATKALEQFWKDDEFSNATKRKGERAWKRFDELTKKHDMCLEHRGLGMIQGVEFPSSDPVDAIMHEAFQRGLVIESAGSHGQVLKLLAPLVIEEDAIDKGMDILEEAFDAVAKSDVGKKAAEAAKG
ncbi:MAG TPA: diaminobutyrate--2-oxoglutarate transaminase [Sandaracinaceae bacterium LLY-WYZ-13_1]|nr:diaminobutyrate--2-oxoglutarate transaminase [Sandaracinaceae bacterium LLY-WYZ-13_1]